MISIFLSYARDDDEAFVRRLHADLTSAEFDVWFDRVSMPSRQLTFHQEVRDAIAARERLLLVVGPGVLASDYVTQEWRFAYFEAGKCVNPVVRLNGRHEDGSVIDGYELIPEDLKLLHAEDFRDDAAYDVHLANLIRQLSEPIPPVGKLVAVPELPACFITQPDRIKTLRDLLLIDLQKPVVVSGVAARVGLQGMGGIGKSVLASALAHRPEVRRAFPDGIFWITLGQKPQLAEQQRWLARELGDEALFPDERSGKECLRKLLAGRKALLVLDDVWQREDAEAFNVIGAMGRILLTTRDAGLVTALASKETHYRVELPTEAEAETIFEAAAHLEPGAMPAAALEIVAQCGRLPLALALCGGMVLGGISPADVLEALREHDLEFLSSDHPAEEQHRNAWKAMDVSLRVLPPEQRDRFAELAVFALDRGAPEAAVVTLWEHTGGLSPRHARKLLADFAARSLVQITPAAEGDQADAIITLHDLLHNFATGMAEKLFGSRAMLHQTLLDAYRKKCPNGWPSGPDDGYFFQNLCKHLLAAVKLDDAVELLTDFSWIEAKCRTKLVFSLQDDYRNTIGAMPEAQEGLRKERERQARLARWTEEITAYSRQWSERRDRPPQCDGDAVDEPEPQLPESPATCRMWTEEEIEAECKRIIENPTRLDRMQAFVHFVEQECYPLIAFGTRPGFVAQHAFNNAPRGPVHEAAARALPAVKLPLLTRHWFAKDQYNPRPALQRTLEGHGRRCYGYQLGITPDGQCAVSVSSDGELRVWSLKTGICLQVLEHPSRRNSDAFDTSVVRSFRCVSVTPDGRWAVSGSEDSNLQVWDLESGVCLHVLEGHKDGVNHVRVMPDGRHAASVSNDPTVRVWDLREAICSFSAEMEASSWSLSVTPDCRRSVAGNFKGQLCVGDLEPGGRFSVIQGHERAVTSVDVMADGRRAISASPDQTLKAWDLDTGECLRSVKIGDIPQKEDLRQESKDLYVDAPPVYVSVTPDCRRAVSASVLDSHLRVWDMESGKCLRILEGHTDIVRDVCINADGQRAVSISDDSTLRVWDLEKSNSSEMQAGRICRVESLIAGGQRLVSSNESTLQVFDLESGECLRVMNGHTKPVNRVAVAEDGGRAVSVSFDNTLRVWDLGTGTCLHVLEGHSGWMSSISVTPDGRRAVSGSFDKTLRVWDLGTGTCLHVLEGHSGGVSSISVTPDGRRAVSGSLDKTLRVWDIETGVCLRVLEGHTNECISAMSVTPDGQRVLSACRDQFRVWDLQTGICLGRLEGHTSWIRSLSFTPDAQLVVSASDDRTLRVWDLATGMCVQVLEGHTAEVTHVSVIPNGRCAISASDDLTLRIWDIDAGTSLALARLSARFSGVAISPVVGRIVVSTLGTEWIQLDLRGQGWDEIEGCELVAQDPETQLKQEIGASIARLGPSHRNTLLGKLSLAARFDQAGRGSEATDMRQEVADICFSQEGRALSAVREVIEWLIARRVINADPKLDLNGMASIANHAGNESGVIAELRAWVDCLDSFKIRGHHFDLKMVELRQLLSRTVTAADSRPFKIDRLIERTFCPECGSYFSVAPSKVACPKCKSVWVNENNTMTSCKSCGAMVEPGFNYCPDCGCHHLRQ